MKNNALKRTFLVTICAAALTVLSSLAYAQNEGVPTQALVAVEGKSAPPQQVTVEVQGKKAPVSSWQPISPAHTQVALLIDDGLRESIGRNLNEVKSFIQGLPPGTEVLVGYMRNGTVATAQPFTTEHDQAAAALRLPLGVPGESASPYLCLSDFLRHWPGEAPQANGAPPTILPGTPQGSGTARFVLMITNGVDPYNGSTSVLNQDSPYVQAAATDAERAGVPVYTLYFGDAGIRGPSANFSGQNYLQQVAAASGGQNLYQGSISLPDLLPYLKEFTASLARTYVVTFEAPRSESSRPRLLRLKVSAPHTKLRAPQAIQPGNRE